MMTDTEYKQLKPYFKNKSKIQIWNILKKKSKEKAIKENRIVYIFEIIKEVLI